MKDRTLLNLPSIIYSLINRTSHITIHPTWNCGKRVEVVTYHRPTKPTKVLFVDKHRYKNLSRDYDVSALF